MLKLYFKQIELGYFEYKNNFLIYNSNLNGEKILKNTYPVSSIYGLFNSKNKVISDLPVFLENILNMEKNNDYKIMAKIEENDNIYDKLVKFSGLNLSKNEFYLVKE